ncbi:MAG: AMP-binding protein, partial [Deltaproteobacteria bacterium]|nr:AMP-binding protein [Deltaproteobacteria bacterium]
MARHPAQGTKPVRRERGRLREDLHDAAEGIASVEDRAAATHGFHAVRQARVDSGEVLVGAVSVGGVVQADPVDQQEDLVADESPDDGRTAAVGRLLDPDARLVRQGLGRGSDHLLPELVVAFYACLKLGAVIVPVFAGFGPQALAVRMQDSGAKVIFTADGSYRRGRPFAIKPGVDEAAASCPTVTRVVVVRRTGQPVKEWKDGRDLWWHEVVPGQS